ncbi:MAG: ClpXP protease specificity-enhancing factor [Pseudomonadota bacterium]
MSDLISTKPYMIRAIHEWCVDNNLTPHLLVAVNLQTRVPVAFVKEGEIVLNLNYSATKDLHMDNEAIVFSARFSGASQNLYVPMNAVKGIFARENGQGMFFEIETKADTESVSSAADSNQLPKSTVATGKKKPTLTIVK